MKPKFEIGQTVIAYGFTPAKGKVRSSWFTNNTFYKASYLVTFENYQTDLPDSEVTRVTEEQLKAYSMPKTCLNAVYLWIDESNLKLADLRPSKLRKDIRKDLLK